MHAGPDMQAQCWIKEASPKGRTRGEWGDQREEDTRKGVGGGGGNGDCGATTEQGLATGAEQERSVTFVATIIGRKISTFPHKPLIYQGRPILVLPILASLPALLSKSTVSPRDQLRTGCCEE